MKSEVLLMLKEKNDYISGEGIGARLNISRTQVWKYINSLKEDGYDIDASTRRGYRLSGCPDRLLYDEFAPFLNTKYIGRNVIHFEATTSTNDIAKGEAQNGAKEGTVVIAEEQTKGRGRMGRKWISNSGQDILISIILRPNINAYIAPSITPVLAVSIVEALRELTGYSTFIKWPNDVVLEYKKLCGILTEMSAEVDNVNYIVVGMGLNVNSVDFSQEIKDIAVSLKEYSGECFNRKVILAKILNRFEENYEDFKKDGISPFIEGLRRYSAVLGKKVTVSNMGSSIEGCAVNIDDEGKLIIRTEDGKIEKILSGDVTIEGIYGNKTI